MAPTPREPIYRWPDWLRPAMVDGYGIKPEDRRIPSEFDIGSQFRIEFDTDETTASCSVFLDPIQSDWFEAFERDALVQGSRWFYMPLWVGGQLTDHLVRFKTRPEMVAKSGESSQYNFELDVARRENLMDSGLVWILLMFSPKEWFDYTSRLHYILHILMPENGGVTNIPEGLADDYA